MIGDCRLNIEMGIGVSQRALYNVNTVFVFIAGKMSYVNVYTLLYFTGEVWIWLQVL